MDAKMPPQMVKLFKEFRQEMREMKDAIERELRKEHKDLKQSVDYVSEQFDAMAKRCTKIEKEKAALKKANAALTAECELLTQHTKILENRVTDLEQYSRNKNIEIKGVELADGENLLEMIKKLGDVVNEPVTEADIEVCHRVPRKDGGCPNIVVQFCTRAKRGALIQAARKKRVNASELGLPGRSPVFINEHLCPSIKKLLGQVTARKKEKSWKYAWTKEGKIFARKTDESRVLRVTCAEDIDKIE